MSFGQALRRDTSSYRSSEDRASFFLTGQADSQISVQVVTKRSWAFAVSDAEDAPSKVVRLRRDVVSILSRLSTSGRPEVWHEAMMARFDNS